MRPTKNWLTTLAVATVLGAGIATAAAGDDGPPSRHRGGRHGRADVDRRTPGGRMRARMGHIRKARREFVQSLAFTDAQQRTALERSRAAQPIVAEARKELARIAVASRSAEQPSAGREARRDAVRDLRKRTAERLAPLAKDLLATLTPEQRAKIEGFAAARGRKVDDDKLTRRIGRWLARPMTADLLEAKLGTR